MVRLEGRIDGAQNSKHKQDVSSTRVCVNYDRRGSKTVNTRHSNTAFCFTWFGGPHMCKVEADGGFVARRTIRSLLLPQPFVLALFNGMLSICGAAMMT